MSAYSYMYTKNFESYIKIDRLNVERNRQKEKKYLLFQSLEESL
jgi:hypothetical protein